MLKIGDILRIEVMPALGCTEPISEALAAATARSVLGGRLLSLEMSVDSDTFKNSFDVGIPGASSVRGNRLAAALGYVAGRAERGLEVLDGVGPDEERKARRLVERGLVHVQLDGKAKELFVAARAQTTRGTAEVVISGHHAAVTSVKLNGRVVADRAGLPRTVADHERVHKGLRRLDSGEMVRMIDALTPDEAAFIRKGIEMNVRMARRGMREKLPLSLGRRMRRVLPRGPVAEAGWLTAAAVEARMSGVTLPVMSSGGSGNCGIAATIPVIVAAGSEGVRDRMCVAKAVALSHLVNAWIKAFIGRRSAVCGGAVSAGSGACAGIIYLFGGTARMIDAGINGMMASLACVLCDGARPECALKLAHGASHSLGIALLVAKGGLPAAGGGILGLTAEETVRNLGRLVRGKMRGVNRAVISSMRDRES